MLIIRVQHTYTYIYAYNIYTHTYVYQCLDLWVPVGMYVCVYMLSCGYLWVCMYVYICCAGLDTDTHIWKCMLYAYYDRGPHMHVMTPQVPTGLDTDTHIWKYRTHVFVYVYQCLDLWVPVGMYVCVYMLYAYYDPTGTHRSRHWYTYI